MLTRMVIESFARRRSRKLLAVAAVWIGISLVVALLTLSLDVGDKTSRELQSFGANIRVEPAASAVPVRVGGYELADSVEQAYLTEADVARLDTIFWKNNITGAVPRLWASAKVAGRPVRLLGVWFSQRLAVSGVTADATGAMRVYKHWRVDGAWPSGEGECLIGVNLAAKHSWTVGSAIPVDGGAEHRRFRVTGIVTTGDREDDALIAPLHEVQMLAGLAGKVSEVDIAALTTPDNQLAQKYHLDPSALSPAEYERWVCTPYPGSIAANVRQVFAGSTARVVRRVTQTQGAVLTRIEGLMLLLGAVAVIACSLSVMGVLASAVVERRKETALLQALGAHRGDVLMLFMFETGVIGLVGGCLAAVTGIALGRWLVGAVFASTAEPHVALMILAPVLGLVIALAGSAWPVWRTVNEDTAVVLHGN